METTEKETIAELAAKIIMRKIGVTRWTIRCQRALDFLAEENDIEHLTRYHVHETRDREFLSRMKKEDRMGVEIGVNKYGNQISHVFFYRTQN